MRIIVIGAGHAGVEAAASARQAGADVVLFSEERSLPYFRPRLPSVAFGQLAPEAIAIHPSAWYAAKGIDLRLDAAVRAIDPVGRTVCSAAGREPYDALVLAAGAVPLMPAIEGLSPDLPLHTLWSQADAARLRGQAASGRHLVVVGGGILGLEAALRAREANLEVTVVERMNRLMPMQFGAAGSAVIQDTLESIGVTVLTDARLMAVDRHAEGVRLMLANREPLQADLMLLAIGARPNLALARAAGLKTDLGICVDGYLQTSASNVFAAGDAAQPGAVPRCSVRSATSQGRLAGANAAAAAAGSPLTRHDNREFPVLFKSRELELCAIGKTVSDLLTESRLDDGVQPSRYQAVVRDGSAVVGVQMIGTREGFDGLASQLEMPRDFAPRDA
jgi:NADPH-dependent 2,4-dienoyl-CoA reductase/sulfur reductase-like enzyme